MIPNKWFNRSRHIIIKTLHYLSKQSVHFNVFSSSLEFFAFMSTTRNDALKEGELSEYRVLKMLSQFISQMNLLRYYNFSISIFIISLFLGIFLVIMHFFYRKFDLTVQDWLMVLHCFFLCKRSTIC